MAVKGRKTSSKNPPILSHEFIIQNHGDIVSCIAMLFVIGLMVQVTSPVAYMFIALHHNITNTQFDPTYGATIETINYSYGWKDACAVFFYFLICIVMHAIVQEYILDKFSRKLHLSKSKHSKFNESGQLLVFYLISILWGGDVIFREQLLLNISSLWTGYPHIEMAFTLKFFYIIQIAYWLHCYPELYFQKTKRDELFSRTLYPTLHLIFITAAYVLNFSRVGVFLLVLQYTSEALFHAARLIYFTDKTGEGKKGGYVVANAVFVLVRLTSVILSVLTFWYGLALNDSPVIDVAAGNFNTQLVRINALVGVGLLQAWLLWNFLTFYMRHMREQSSSGTQKSAARKPKPIDRSKAKKKKEDKREDDELTEVDQNTKKNLRARPAAAAQKAK